jgi:hypothetical protein
MVLTYVPKGGELTTVKLVKVVRNNVGNKNRKTALKIEKLRVRFL